jgi:hypothetical protein
MKTQPNFMRGQCLKENYNSYYFLKNFFTYRNITYIFEKIVKEIFEIKTY